MGLVSEVFKIAAWTPAYGERVSSHLTAQYIRDYRSCTNAGHEYVYWSNHSCDLVALRNQAAFKATTEGYDFLLMQDADVFSEVPGGPYMRLLATALETGAALTGALVTMRTRPPKANAWGVDGEPIQPGSVFECSKIGSGMILIDLRQIRTWWGVSYMGPLFDVVYETYTNPETGERFEPKARKAVGMDVWFSKLLRANGMSVWCDARIPTTHVDDMHRHDFDGETIPDLAGSPGRSDSAEPRTQATAAQTGD